jgi:hypothetical protein
VIKTPNYSINNKGEITRKRQGNTTPQKSNNNSMEDFVENEGKVNPTADPSRKITSRSKEEC